MHNLCWINDNIPNSQMRPEILQQMLQTVLNIIMFEDCRLKLPRISFNSIKSVVRNQWSMSRPLLGLILLNEDYFQVVLWKTMKILLFVSNLFLHQNLRDQVIASQQADKRAAMMTWSEFVRPPWNCFKTIFFAGLRILWRGSREPCWQRTETASLRTFQSSAGT